jgi:2,4-dienoyl-CoA reductase-like NADH-dependent reductase (Old Yellow Enzyme family)
MNRLFTPLTIRQATFPNRAWVSPMCQYSAIDGIVGDWHLVHLGSLTAGRPGLIMAEATGVQPEGRISVSCPGIWNDDQVAAWRRVVDFVHGQGTLIGLQLAHAGRKASTCAPWLGYRYVEPQHGGWQTVAPSAIAYGAFPEPRALTTDDVARLVEDFADAARRAESAGFDVVEIHMAHGYLLHQFLSPLSNQRTDEFGGSLENRMRVPLAVARAVRAAWPADRPVFVRISSTDWIDGGWDVEQSITFVRELMAAGVDLIDASSAGLRTDQVVPPDTDYQVDNAARIKAATGALVAAVGRITRPQQAEDILNEGKADSVFLAREILRNPRWPLTAAAALGVEQEWPPQYARAKEQS